MIDSRLLTGLWYVGTPYSKYPARDGLSGIEAAFRDAAALTGELLRHGVKAYSPITHTHPIAIYGGIDPLDHDIWLPFDATLMHAADGMIVLQMEGWESSYGIKHEIAVFTSADKPIVYIDPADLSPAVPFVTGEGSRIVGETIHGEGG